MKLSDMQCKTAKTADRPLKIFDGQGLYLEVSKSGSKIWRLKYRINGKEKLLTLGRYPDTSLLSARKKTLEAKMQLLEGIDPSLEKLEKKQTAFLEQSHLFRNLAIEWHEKQLASWKPSHAKIIMHRLEKYIFPDLGSYPVNQVKPMVMLACLQKAEKTAPELTRRLKSYCSHIFKYAIATGRAEIDPTYGLEAALKKYKKGHYPAIDVDEFPEFLEALKGFQNRITRQTYLAIMLLMLTFVRTSELIKAKWDEFDLEKGMWVVPAERMKMKLPHMVPLAKQTIEILLELKSMNEGNKLVFPSPYESSKPISTNTILMVLKRMGYRGRMTGHGFRSLALGLLEEKIGIPHKIADRQLAHVPKSSVDRAYDRAKFLNQRIEMMQKYADCIYEWGMN